MAKRMQSYNLEDEVIQAIADNADQIGMSRSAFVNLVMGTACEVYKAPESLSAMWDSAKQKKAAEESGESVLATA